MDPSHPGSSLRRLPPASVVLVGLAVLLLVLWPRLRPTDPKVPDSRPRAVIAPAGDAPPEQAARPRAKRRLRAPRRVAVQTVSRRRQARVREQRKAPTASSPPVVVTTAPVQPTQVAAPAGAAAREFGWP